MQLPLLSEVDHVLKRTYLSRKSVTNFLNSLITNRNLAGEDHCAFWRGVKFLNIQGGGNSQREMQALFDTYLRGHCGFGIADCGGSATTFIYIDDVIFSGNRAKEDLTKWIKDSAPANAKVHIITMAVHLGGKHFAETKISAEANKKQITLEWWPCMELEDRKKYVDRSDVLRPRHLGNNPLVAEYAESLHREVNLRTRDSIGKHRIFSSEQGRAILEQAMLEAGVRVRKKCPFLPDSHRPLGYAKLKTLGFGSTIVTFRNCPNNVPLAFWVNDPWYPLFKRKNNK